MTRCPERWLGMEAEGSSAVTSRSPVVSGAKKHGRKNVLVRVEREVSSRFVALPLETG